MQGSRPRCCLTRDEQLWSSIHEGPQDASYRGVPAPWTRNSLRDDELRVELVFTPISVISVKTSCLGGSHYGAVHAFADRARRAS